MSHTCSAVFTSTLKSWPLLLCLLFYSHYNEAQTPLTDAINNAVVVSHHKSNSWLSRSGFINLDTAGQLTRWAVPKTKGNFSESTNEGVVGHAFNFTDYFNADWNGDGKTDLICRNAAGSLFFYPWNASANSFYGVDGGKNVGNGFNFTHYFVADWTGDGIADLICRNESGSLFLYPFRYDTFKGNGGGNIVGNGFHFTHYFIADWTGDGIPDLICRNSEGSLRLYPFSNNTFIGNNGGSVVGNGFNFDHYFIGEWTGDNRPDLACTDRSGNLYLYPFKNNTFIGNKGGAQIGQGMNFQDYFVADFSGDGLSDIIALDRTGNYYSLPFKNRIYSTATASEELKWKYSRCLLGFF